MFRKHAAGLLGISVEGVWYRAAFARDRRLHLPLLGDLTQGRRLPRLSRKRGRLRARNICPRNGVRPDGAYANLVARIQMRLAADADA